MSRLLLKEAGAKLNKPLRDPIPRSQAIAVAPLDGRGPEHAGEPLFRTLTEELKKIANEHLDKSVLRSS